MSSITAIILTKNEEKLIADCIHSVSFCDEIIIIDAGSDDKTVEIAKKMNATVFTHTYTDFAKARNMGLQKAKSEWVFYIDADERVDETLGVIMQKAVKNPVEHISAYTVKRKNFYLGNHEWPQIERMERLFKKDKLTGWYGQLHESPKITGTVAALEGFLLHYTHRNLTVMVSKTNIWSETEAKLRFDAHHPLITWWRFPRVMIPAFYDSYIRQQGYKAGIVGLIESIYQSFSIFITYAKLWEMQQDSD
jgi:glycosyltransferase involved in cell wall biosynthesis